MSEETNYWIARRLSRRSALGVGATGVAALGLAACSSSTNNNGGNKAAATSATAGNKGLLPAAASATPVARQAKPGGVLTFQVSAPPPSLDPYTQTSFLCSYQNGLTYSKLYRYKAGVPEVAPADIAMEPDLAAAMPELPDKQKIIVKLKPGIKFQNVPPLNGRALTSEDIRYAVDRYQNYDKSVQKSNYVWLDKLEMPDPQTIVFNTKYPYADFVQIMGGNLGAYISPKEVAEGADAATKMAGTGPFIHTEFQTGVSLSYKKNPDYYDKPYPYVDEVKSFIVPDTAKRVADFSAKSVDLTWLFLPDERDQLKKNRPDAKFDEQQGIGGYIYLRGDKPPFNDKRVRQALSMSIDRKAIRDAITKGEGVSDQILFVGIEGWARQVKDLGTAAKYWDHNPGEAKKLLAAAGAENLSFTWNHADAAPYTQAYVDTSTLAQAQFKEVGITVTDNQQTYAQYISTTYQGNYEGVGHSPRAVPYWIDYLTERLTMKPQRGRINLSYVNNPALEDLLDKQRAEFDTNARKKIITQIEDICAEEQYEIYFSTDTRTYFWAPDVQNYRPTAFFPYTHLMKAWHDK